MGSRFKSEGVHEIPASFSRGAGIFLLWQSIQVTEQTTFAKMTGEQQVESLIPWAQAVLGAYGLTGAKIESINHEFNSTFKVTSQAGERFALRVNVNSTKSIDNLRAEIFWMSKITQVKTPTPVARQDGEYISSAWHDASARDLNAVLFTWLEGEEVGDEPTDEQLFAAGAAMAKLHQNSKSLSFEGRANLPRLDGVLGGADDHLLDDKSNLSDTERELVKRAFKRIAEVVHAQFAHHTPQPIHADMHGWNLMWHDGELAVFDFDDAGIGTPLQDLATSLYYLDTPEQDAAWLKGYESVAPLPEFSADDIVALRMQRRLILLNYLHESTTPEHREMVGEYSIETMRRLTEWLQ